MASSSRTIVSAWRWICWNAIAFPGIAARVDQVGEPLLLQRERFEARRFDPDDQGIAAVRPDTLQLPDLGLLGG